MPSYLPLVSLIVRTKDRPRFLKQAIRSVAAQYYHNIELILVNDGGCDLDIDELKMILKNKPLRYIRNEQSLGRSHAGNLGIEKISGHYFGFLDDDDLLLPEHVKTLVTFLEKSDYLVAYTDVEEYQKTFDLKTQSYESQLLMSYAKDFNFNELLLYNYIPFNALLFDASVIEDEKLDTSLELYEDWDFLIRLAAKYPFYHLSQLTAHYNKWSNDLQINNLAYADTMRNNQNVIIERYSALIPANFLRSLWSDHLTDTQSIQSLKKETAKLNDIIHQKQALINTTQEHLDKTTQEHLDKKQADLKEKQADLKEKQALIADSQSALNKLQQINNEYIQVNGQCKREIIKIKDHYQRKLTHSQQQFNEQIAEQTLQLTSKLDEIKQLNESLHLLNGSLHTIHISLAWRTILRIRKLIDFLLPPHSRRKQLYLSLRNQLGKTIRFFVKKKHLPQPVSPENTLAVENSEQAHQPNSKPLIENPEHKNSQQSSLSLEEASNTIILISHDFHRAGAQINLIQGGKVLRDNYNKNIIFVALKDGDYRSEFEKVGQEVYALFPQTLEPFVINHEVEALFNRFKQRGITQCICNTVVTGSLAPLLQQLGFSFVNLIHELPVTVNIYDFHQAVAAIKLFSKNVVFSSAYTRNSYINNYGIERSNTKVKAQGCYFSTDYFGKKEEAKKQLRKQLFLPPSATIILTCGHLYFRKGPDIFLDLAEKILQHDSNKHFHFVWLGGHEYEALNWFNHDKQKMGIEDHVQYIDFVDEPSLFYAGADIFVLPAREDPFPTVVMEAMDNGTPVIAFNDAGGIPELLSEQCGIVVPFLDTTKMANEILNLLDDQMLYNSMVNNAKKRVLNDYDFDSYMLYLLSLLEQTSAADAISRNDDASSEDTTRIAIANKVAHPYIDQLLTTDKKHSQYCPFIQHHKTDSQLKMIAFFLPQFHPIPENDEWWGKGFTEWTNVTRAVPQFVGHYQPKLPGELGFYDLRLPEVGQRQVELARNYGISGFCFYHYWFSGRRILEKPLEQMLADKDLDMPFCLCWANENWSRRWDGSEDDILLEQQYRPEDDINFIRDIARYLSDPRYIKIDGKPLLLIYRPDLLPDPATSAQIWRKWCLENGIGEIYLCNVHSFDHLNPLSLGYNAAVEFPPNLFPLDLYNDQVELINSEYKGKVYHYPQLVESAYHYSTPDYTRFRGVTPGWDNEARRSGRGTSFINSTPQIYQKWLQHISHYTESHLAENEQFIFINAWNEWAEGACLEPDNKFGYAFLEATRNVLWQFNDKKRQLIHQTTENLKASSTIAVIIHLFYFDLWDEIKSYLANIPENYDLYVSISDGFSLAQVQTLLNDFPQVRLFSLENRGRDIYPFMHIFKLIDPLNYQYVCKIHSKKSSHTDVGDSWRENIFKELLGSEKQIRQIISYFNKHKSVGIIAPEQYLIRFYDCVGFNDELAEKNLYYINSFLHQLNAHVLEDECFVTGSMFWFRPSALSQLLTLDISASDYPIEEGQIDGTIMHALERVLALTARVSDYDYIDTGFIEHSK